MKGQETSRAAPSQPARKRLRLHSVPFLILILLIIYNSNLRCVRSDNTLPQRFLPFSVVMNHNLYLDGWISRKLVIWHSPEGLYFARDVHGHWLSSYPLILPLLLVPLYWLPGKLLAAHWASPAVSSALFPLVVDTMEKLSASLIAALSVVILYMALRKKTSEGVSLIIAGVFGLASNTFCTSSQALWRHGFTELCFAFLIWALWRESSDASRAFWAGLALAAATANKPADAAILLPFLLYFALRSRKEFLYALIPMIALGIPVLAYNFLIFGKILGGYPNPLLVYRQRHLSVAFRILAYPGPLINPNRGLLVFAPWTIFALWGAARMWKENSYGWARHLICGMALVYFLQVRFGDWWGGQCFGPIYMTDLLPFFAIFLLPVWERIRSVRKLRVGFAAAVAVALWVQVLGVYYYPRGSWGASPVSVDIAPARLWDWKDTQIRRTWRAGPASPTLAYRWIGYLDNRQVANPTGQVPQPGSR